MSGTKVITGKVRFSYTHVFEPHAVEEGQEKKYSISLIIPKKDKKTVTAIKKAIKTALEEGKAKFGGKIPKNYKDPLRDGDEDRPDQEEYANSYFVNANSTRKPELVDENLDPILDKGEFYSGCYGRASINLYAFSVSGNKGVAVGLNNLQKLEDGESLGAAVSSAEDDFGSFEDEDEDDLM